VHGLDALAGTFERVCAGSAPKHAAARVEQLATLVSRRGACAHPDGTARFAMSAVDVFAEELADHARHGACDACAHPSQMPLPRRGAAGA
jgi:NADH:ubiquinone oxidoreductase subunit F (NADH-binding)